jgi:hypothetical protein
MFYYFLAVRSKTSSAANLHSLAEQLNQKTSHFLSEFIQNADDNEYDDCLPTLNLTYENNGLLVESNEKGFTAENVEALCTIGQSTKAGVDHSIRYIGEKGIGFKSVFKAVDVIWISSGEYSFMFDKKEPLGMITPHWCPFPGRKTQGYTSFYMQLSAGYDKEELIHDINSLDPRMLIFLRRLREININVIQNNKISKTRLTRTDEEISQGRITKLNQDGVSLRYYLNIHPVNSLPKERKRPNCSQSEIAIAFPLTDPALGPDLTSQNVYAFLPIRDYGFKASK